MDPVVWTGIVGIVGSLTTLAAALITNYRADLRERKRQQHEKELKALELEEKKQDKKRDENIRAYRDLLQRTRDINSRAPYEFTDLLEAFSEIELVSESPEIVAAAWELVGSCNDARKIATDAYKEDRDRDPATVPTVREAIVVKDHVRNFFMQLAREDLGISAPSGTEALGEGKPWLP